MNYRYSTDISGGAAADRSPKEFFWLERRCALVHYVRFYKTAMLLNNSMIIIVLQSNASGAGWVRRKMHYKIYLVPSIVRSG